MSPHRSSSGSGACHSEEQPRADTDKRAPVLQRTSDLQSLSVATLPDGSRVSAAERDCEGVRWLASTDALQGLPLRRLERTGYNRTDTTLTNSCAIARRAVHEGNRIMTPAHAGLVVNQALFATDGLRKILGISYLISGAKGE